MADRLSVISVDRSSMASSGVFMSAGDANNNDKNIDLPSTKAYERSCNQRRMTEVNSGSRSNNFANDAYRYRVCSRATQTGTAKGIDASCEQSSRRQVFRRANSLPSFDAASHIEIIAAAERRGVERHRTFCRRHLMAAAVQHRRKHHTISYDDDEQPILVTPTDYLCSTDDEFSGASSDCDDDHLLAAVASSTTGTSVARRSAVIYSSSDARCSLAVFLRPPTVFLLAIAVALLLYGSLSTDAEFLAEEKRQNVSKGLMTVVCFFMVIVLLTFPRGPFHRPHPAIYTVLFCLSLAYFIAVAVTALVLSRAQAHSLLESVYPELAGSTLPPREYADQCSLGELTPQRFLSQVDNFCVGHLVGWVVKAVLIRHYGVAWAISLLWEVTELFFAHLLPNFYECWWDSLLLDVILCNGVGIYLGMKLCQWFGYRDYDWIGAVDVPTLYVRVKRRLCSTFSLLGSVCQFKGDGNHVQRRLPMNARHAVKRTLGVAFFILLWQLNELNTFFLKQIFQIEQGHPLTLLRLCLITSISAPSIAQFVRYFCVRHSPHFEDARLSGKRAPSVKIGAQLWLFLGITAFETVISVRLGIGEHVFDDVSYALVGGWFAFLLLFSAVVANAVWLYHAPLGQTNDAKKSKAL